MPDILVQADLPAALIEGIEARWPSSTTRVEPERLTDAIESVRPDVLVLRADEAGGLQRVRAIRQRRPNLSIALVTDVDVSLHGSRAGAPPDAVELIYRGVPTDVVVQRIEALARSSAPPRLELQRGTVDLATGQLHIDGRSGRLTGLELRLLLALSRPPGAPRDAGDILEEVWGYDRSTRTRVLPAAIYRLRRKIDSTPPAHIVTDEHGRYSLRADVLEPEPPTVAVPRWVTAYQPTRMIARADPMATALDALERRSRCVVHGPPGVGRSRFAAEVARAWLARSPTRRRVIRVTDPALIDGPEHVFGPYGSEPDADPPDIGLRRRLLVLDPDSPRDDALGRLLARDGVPEDLALLAVGGPAGVPATAPAIGLDPLTIEEGARLILHHLRDVGAEPDDTPATTAAVDDLARVADGLPQALVFFARLCRFSAPPEVARRFARAAHLLPAPHDPPAFSLERSQRSLVALVDHLDPARAELARQLSVFAADFTFDMARRVVDPDTPAEDLDALASSGVVLRSSPGAAAGIRYRMLEPARRVLWDAMGPSRQRRALASRHRRLCLGRAGLSDAPSTGDDGIEPVDCRELCAAFAHSLSHNLGPVTPLMRLIGGRSSAEQAAAGWAALRARAYALFPDLER